MRLISPDEPELDRIWAVPAVAFGHPGTRAGLARVIERDKIAADHDERTMDMLRERVRSGQSVLAAAFGPDGPLAAGSCQPLAGVAEITGVGVLPSARRMGLGGAVTAALAGEALRRGVQTVFLSASDEGRGPRLRPAGVRAHRHRHDRGTGFLEVGPVSSRRSRISAAGARPASRTVSRVRCGWSA